MSASWISHKAMHPNCVSNVPLGLQPSIGCRNPKSFASPPTSFASPPLLLRINICLIHLSFEFKEHLLTIVEALIIRQWRDHLLKIEPLLCRASVPSSIRSARWGRFVDVNGSQTPRRFRVWPYFELDLWHKLCGMYCTISNVAKIYSRYQIMKPGLPQISKQVPKRYFQHEGNPSWKFHSLVW